MIKQSKEVPQELSIPVNNEVCGYLVDMLEVPADNGQGMSTPVFFQLADVTNIVEKPAKPKRRMAVK